MKRLWLALCVQGLALFSMKPTSSLSETQIRREEGKRKFPLEEERGVRGRLLAEGFSQTQQDAISKILSAGIREVAGEGPSLDPSLVDVNALATILNIAPQKFEKISKGAALQIVLMEINNRLQVAPSKKSSQEGLDFTKVLGDGSSAPTTPNALYEVSSSTSETSDDTNLVPKPRKRGGGLIGGIGAFTLIQGSRIANFILGRTRMTLEKREERKNLRNARLTFR